MTETPTKWYYNIYNHKEIYVHGISQPQRHSQHQLRNSNVLRRDTQLQWCRDFHNDNHQQWNCTQFSIFLIPSTIFLMFFFQNSCFWFLKKSWVLEFLLFRRFSMTLIRVIDNFCWIRRFFKAKSMFFCCGSEKSRSQGFGKH